MAELELAPAATGAGLVGVAPGVLGGHPGHHLGRRLPAPEQVRHHLHRGAGVLEERLEPGAHVVVARLAVRGGREAVLGASSVAEEAHLAALALPR